MRLRVVMDAHLHSPAVATIECPFAASKSCTITNVEVVMQGIPTAYTRLVL